jgi:hypothetical protein
MNAAEKNAGLALKIVLAIMGIDISKNELWDMCFKNPYFPTLLSISDLLKKFSIESVASRMTLSSLSSIRSWPALAFVHTDGGRFVVIERIDSGYVYWIHTDKGKTRSSEKDFEAIWSGIALVLTKPEDVINSRILSRYKRRTLRTLFCLILLVLLSFYCWLLLWIRFSNAGLDSSYFEIAWFNILVSALGILSVCRAAQKSVSARLQETFNIENIVSRVIFQSMKSTFLPNDKILFCLYFSYFFTSILSDFLIVYFNYGVSDFCFAFVSFFLLILSVFQIIQRRERLVPTDMHIAMAVAVTIVLRFFYNPVQKISSEQFVNLYFGLPVFVFSTIACICIVRSIRPKAENFYAVNRFIARTKFDQQNVEKIVKQERTMAPIMEGMHVYYLGNSILRDNFTLVVDPRYPDLHSLMREVIHISCTFSEISVRVVFSYLAPFPKHYELLNLFKYVPLNDFNGLVEWSFIHQNLAKSKSYDYKDNSSELASISNHYNWSVLSGVKSELQFFFNDISLPSYIQIDDLRNFYRIYKSIKSQ